MIPNTQTSTTKITLSNQQVTQQPLSQALCVTLNLLLICSDLTLFHERIIF